MTNIAEQYIAQYNMKMHPEGGYYTPMYRSANNISYQNEERQLYSSIYYLLMSGQKSCFHRLKTDEIWHFYDGCPLVIHELKSDGSYSFILFGKDCPIPTFQYLISAGNWFAATPLVEDSFSLIGCTLSPGFEFEDFELAESSYLLQKYPDYHKIISTFTE
jgi:predicted cupin superfamily sugar epimerase